MKQSVYHKVCLVAPAFSIGRLMDSQWQNERFRMLIRQNLKWQNRGLNIEWRRDSNCTTEYSKQKQGIFKETLKQFISQLSVIACLISDRIVSSLQSVSIFSHCIHFNWLPWSIMFSPTVTRDQHINHESTIISRPHYCVAIPMWLFCWGLREEQREVKQILRRILTRYVDLEQPWQQHLFGL